MSATDQISAAFIAARRDGFALPDFPGEVPTTTAEAYAVQHTSSKAWGDAIVGYKVGGIPKPFADDFPGGWLAGPVFDGVVQRVENGGSADVPVFAGGFAAYEAEFVMVLSGLRNLSGPVTSFDEAKSYVSALHIGAEIASSPLATLNALGPGSIISDFGNQAGVIIGPEVDLAWLDRIQDVEVVLTIDGEEIGRATPNPAEGGPLDALRFLLTHLQTLPDDMNFPDTLLLSSGAVTGVHQSTPGTTSTIQFGDLGRFTINMTAHKLRNIET